MADTTSGFDNSKLGQPIDPNNPGIVYGPGGSPIAKNDWDASQNGTNLSQTYGKTGTENTQGADPYKWTPTANVGGQGADPYALDPNSHTYDVGTYSGGGVPGTVASLALFGGGKGNFNTQLSIDPVTGQMKYGGQTATYSGSQDYGLGPNGLGVLVVASDANGNPTRFYAGTATGGGQEYSTLAEAAQGAKDYTTWYSSQHPAAASASASTSTAQPAGELTTPGSGENYYDSTKGFYTGENNAQNAYDVTANQPTQEEQYWNKYSGIFQNPNYLDQVYDTAEKKAQTTLDRTASSGGWADSGAAARATADMGATYENQKLLAMQGFATTGGTLAGAADASRNQRVSSAQGVDTGNLSQISAGQTAANSAETQQQNRLNGGISSATTLGNDQAQLTASGLDAATSEQLSTNVQAIMLQVQGGNLTAQQGYNQASEMLSGLGTTEKAAVSAYLLQKFPGAKADPYLGGTKSATSTGLGDPYQPGGNG